MQSSVSHSQASHILVTGGAGFIGSHLVERLLAQGEAVTVLDDLSTGCLQNLSAVRQHARLKVIESKVSSCPILEEIVAGAKQIYHLAAVVGVELVIQSAIAALETNLHETEALLKIAAKYRVPFLFASSSEVYGKSDKSAFSEEDDLLIGPPTRSRWSYACSKLMDEFLVLAYGREHQLPVVVARLFNTVGPRQTGRYGMVLPRFIAAARSGEPLRVFGDGGQRRCLCYVADTVEALWRLHNSPAARGEVFNVGGTEETSILGLAESVIRILGSNSTIELIPYEQAYAPGFEDMRQRKPSVEKLNAATGFKPSTTLAEIIKRTHSSK